MFLRNVSLKVNTFSFYARCILCQPKSAKSLVKRKASARQKFSYEIHAGLSGSLT